MSTSPKRSPATAGVPQPARNHSAETPRPFPYDPVAPEFRRAAQGFEDLDAAPHEGSLAARRSQDSSTREAQARQEGRQEGAREAQEILAEQIASERAGMAAAIAQFKAERSAYFEKVEAEVVQLALAIARKILHRESQVDPLLLAGIVKVAMEQIEGATEVSLRVHPQRSAEWRALMSKQMDAAKIPKIIEDPSQAIDGCRLETSMGSAAIGVEVQLKEIEQGLLDLLAARPGATS